jgi:hypothetical protein
LINYLAENFGVSVIFVSERFAKFREPPKIVTASPHIERKQRDLFNSYSHGQKSVFCILLPNGKR